MTCKLINVDGRTLVDIAEHAQVMIVDPPYSERVHSNTRNGRSKAKPVEARELGFNALTDSLLDSIGKIAANIETWSIIYSDIEGTARIREACMDHGATYIRAIPWVRWSMPQLSGDRPPSGCEIINLFYGARKGRKQYRGPGNLIAFNEDSHFAFSDLTVFEEAKVTGPNKSGKHPAEKPLDQALRLVEWFSDPGDLILDPCAGVATVGVAASVLGRSYIGAELDPTWFERGASRLAGAERREFSAKDLDRIQRYASTQDAERKRGRK